MTKYSKINLVYRLQKWMDSVPGQTFLNYAYSWGASIVIAGTLFKLTHLPGANFMLFLGMGTEVVVFFLSAFDRPFDKTAEGRELPTHLTAETEGTFYGEEGEDVAVRGAAAAYAPAADHGFAEGHAPAGGYVGGGVSGGIGGGTIIIGGGAASAGATEVGEAGEAGNSGLSGNTGISGTSGISGTVGVGGPVVAGAWVGQQQENTPEMAEAQSNYVDALNSLTEMLSKVSAQSERLTRDSEEMENLNRTLTGITKIYEMQLKAASQQVGTIDQINDQTRKMAQQIEELNRIYARMIEAMTVNMPAAAAPRVE